MIIEVLIVHSRQTMSGFLRLPRELRDLIYDYYFKIDGGYTHDFESNKLSRADGLPIDLSLIFVCRQLHSETQELPFNLNTIKFKTGFKEATRKEAAVYHHVSLAVLKKKNMVVKKLLQRFGTDGVMDEISLLYPHSKPFLADWRKDSKHYSWDPPLWDMRKPLSTSLDCIDSILGIISQNPGFLGQSYTGLFSILGIFNLIRTLIMQLFYWVFGGWVPKMVRDGKQALKLKGACLEPWLIPNNQELKRLKKLACMHLQEPSYSPNKHSFSAASHP
ncbi:hypothetical protein ACJQWK_10288 [Exserohilum turcicum]